MKAPDIRLPLALALFILLAGLYVLFPPMTWVGSKPVPLRFVVLSEDGRPIPGAAVAIVHPVDTEQAPKRATTDRQGTATVTNRFLIWGSRMFVFSRTRLSYEPWILEIRAPGYKDLSVPVAELGEDGAKGRLAYPPPRVVRIPMARKRTR